MRFLLALLLGLGLGAPPQAAAFPLPAERCREAEYADSTARRNCHKEWTVLVYMAAENDLTPYAFWDLYEMEASFGGSVRRGGSTLRSDLVVQVDTLGESGIRRLHVTESKMRYERKKLEDFQAPGWDESKIRSRLVEVLDESDGRGEAQRFEEFLQWAALEYPSRHYFVILWGHGKGWGEGAATIDVPSLKRSLEWMSQVIGHPVDLFLSDACLMQTTEVAYEIAGSARFVAGSAQVQSFMGLPYRGLMWLINQGRFHGIDEDAIEPDPEKRDEPYLLARMIPKLYIDSMNPKFGIQGRNEPDAIKTLTSSSINAMEFKSLLAPSLDALGASLAAFIRENPLRVIDLQATIQRTPSFDGSAQDLGIFLGLLERVAREETLRDGGEASPATRELKSAVRATRDALDRSILDYQFGTSYAVDERSKLLTEVARAFSIWLPRTEDEYRSRRAEFESSAFHRDSPGWRMLLSLLFNPEGA